MEDTKEFIDPAERREYMRLPNYCAVEFSIIRLQGDLPGFSIQKGVTQNVSKGGIFLETESLDYHIFKYLSENHVYLDLQIQAPWVPQKIKAVAEVAWFYEPRPGNYEIGLQFKSIADQNLNLLLKDAKGSGSAIRILQASALMAFAGFLLWAVYYFFA